jgi:HlyD family secretion protein
MSGMRRAFFLALAILAGVLGAFGLRALKTGPASDPGVVSAHISAIPEAQPAEAVRVLPASRVLPAIDPRAGERVAASALGKLESMSEEIGVSSDITSRITAILVEEGDEVAAGQPLVQLDDTVYRAKVDAYEAAARVTRARRERLEAGARPEAIRKARAALEEAEALARIARDKAERARSLENGGIYPREETDALAREAEAREAHARETREELAILEHETRAEDLAAGIADLERAEKELAAARAELEKTILRSPITGTVVRRNLRVGEAVSSLQVEPVVTVADLARLRVRAEVDEIDIGKVRLGQRAYAESESLPGLRLDGRVTRLAKTMGRKTIRSLNPNERQDVRIREVLVDLESRADLPLGLRLVVSFVDGD